MIVVLGRNLKFAFIKLKKTNSYEIIKYENSKWISFLNIYEDIEKSKKNLYLNFVRYVVDMCGNDDDYSLEETIDILKSLTNLKYELVWKDLEKSFIQGRDVK